MSEETIAALEREKGFYEARGLKSRAEAVQAELDKLAGAKKPGRQAKASTRADAPTSELETR